MSGLLRAAWRVLRPTPDLETLARRLGPHLARDIGLCHPPCHVLPLGSRVGP